MKKTIQLTFLIFTFLSTGLILRLAYPDIPKPNHVIQVCDFANTNKWVALNAPFKSIRSKSNLSSNHYIEIEYPSSLDGIIFRCLDQLKVDDLYKSTSLSIKLASNKQINVSIFLFRKDQGPLVKDLKLGGNINQVENFMVYLNTPNNYMINSLVGNYDSIGFRINDNPNHANLILDIYELTLK